MRQQHPRCKSATILARTLNLRHLLKKVAFHATPWSEQDNRFRSHSSVLAKGGERYLGENYSTESSLPLMSLADLMRACGQEIWNSDISIVYFRQANSGCLPMKQHEKAHVSGSLDEGIASSNHVFVSNGGASVKKYRHNCLCPNQ